MIEVERVPVGRDCQHCNRTYGTLGCCSTVSNKWVYSCEEGHKEYEETHKQMTLPDAKINLIILGSICSKQPFWDDEMQEAIKTSIKSLDAWNKLKSEIMAIGNWRDESEISNDGVKDCLSIIDRHIAEIRGDTE